MSDTTFRGDMKSGADCSKGREIQQALGTTNRDLDATRETVGLHETALRDQEDCNHEMDLRVSKMEWRTAYWAAGGAVLATLAVQLLMHFVT